MRSQRRSGCISRNCIKMQNKKPDELKFVGLWNFLAERTGLEPATPGVTGRYSNQLNYRSAAVPSKSFGVP